MAKRMLTHAVARRAAKSPALKRVPVMKLLAAAEVAVLARDHVRRLTPEERHRVVELIRAGRGRRRNLTEAEREELSELVAKMQPRRLAGAAIDAMSPVPLPKRLVYGRAGR